MSSPPRVLLVEDDDDHRNLLRIMLERDGAVVDSVGSVDEALWEVEDFLPDVIVSDIVMPVRDAFAMMEILVAGEIPVVAVSGASHLAGRIRSAGFAAFLPKPVSAASLTKAVREVLIRRSAARSTADGEIAP